MDLTARQIFAKNLKIIIEQSHMNQAEVAQRLGVSKGTLCDYCHERSFPRPDKLSQLCEILGVSQYDLTTGNYSPDNFVPNRELLDLAKDLYENSEARSTYIALKNLNKDDLNIIRHLIKKLSGIK